MLFGKIASGDLHLASLPKTLQVKKKRKEGREERTLLCLQSAVKRGTPVGSYPYSLTVGARIEYGKGVCIKALESLTQTVQSVISNFGGSARCAHCRLQARTALSLSDVCSFLFLFLPECPGWTLKVRVVRRSSLPGSQS